MRRLLLVLLLLLTPALFAQVDKSGGTAAHGAADEAHATAHPQEHKPAAEHHEQTYFGIPGWILKLLNMIVFISALVFLAGPGVKRAFAARGVQIRKDAEEAKERRAKSDQMASEIQARLSAIEAEVQAIHERAQIEGERQKRELMTSADTEREKILTAARTEVDNRLKHARTELTEFAGQLAAQRAEQILREKITDQDQKKLFQDSLKEVGEVKS
jgi:F-type H+-transporting ATPase subunit b